MLTKIDVLPQPIAEQQTGAEVLAQAVGHLEDAMERARYDQFQDEAPEALLADLEAKVGDAQFDIIQAAVDLKPIEDLWRGLSDDERVAFVAQFENDIWHALEHVVDHQKR